jgi:hypothetical protein
MHMTAGSTQVDQRGHRVTGKVDFSLKQLKTTGILAAAAPASGVAIRPATFARRPGSREGPPPQSG